MAAETGFLIDGEVYEVPPFDTLNTDEHEVIYNRCGYTVQDFVAPEKETDEETEERERRFNSPSFWRSLMEIAYQRAHPDIKPAKVKALIGGSNFLEALSSLSSEEVDEEVPPALTTEPEKSLPNDSVVSSETSGTDSTNGSDQSASRLVRIGTGRSATSSPEQTQATQAS